MRRVKFTYKEVKEFIEKDNYHLLSTEYMNNHTKLDIKCSKDHIFQMTLADFQQNHRCPICKKCKKYTIDDVKLYIEERGYTLFSTEYINTNSKLKLLCPNNHIFYSSLSNFRNGYKCPICAGNKKLSYDYVKTFIKNKGYNLLSRKYINTYRKLRIKCNKNHEFEMRFNNFQQGQRCPLCKYKNGRSEPEKEILNFISSIYNGSIINNDRKTIKNKKTNCYLELDILLPDINKAIEFNGTYWHSMKNKIILDEIKINESKRKNIGLLTIYEKEWKNNKQLCLNKVKAFITKEDTK